VREGEGYRCGFRDRRGGGRLLLRFFPFGGSTGGGGDLTLGHGASETANVVLEEFIFAFQLVVIRLDFVDAFCEGLQR
jgi:hypothetical protein